MSSPNAIDNGGAGPGASSLNDATGLIEGTTEELDMQWFESIQKYYHQLKTIVPTQKDPKSQIKKLQDLFYELDSLRTVNIAIYSLMQDIEKSIVELSCNKMESSNESFIPTVKLKAPDTHHEQHTEFTEIGDWNKISSVVPLDPQDLQSQDEDRDENKVQQQKTTELENTRIMVRKSYQSAMESVAVKSEMIDNIQLTHERASAQALDHLKTMDDGTNEFIKHLECAKREINLRWQVFKSRHEILLKLNNVNPTNSMILSVMMKDAQLTYELEMLKSCNSKISATDLKIHHVNVLKACMFQFEEKAKHVINLDQVKIFVGQVEQELNLKFEEVEELHAKHISEARELKNKWPSKANYAIGIDLGTTNCCAAVYLDGKVVIVRNNIGWTTTPSTVYFGDQQHIFGESAINRGFDEPVNCVSEMKRIIGRRFNDPTVQSLIPRFSFKVKEDESGFPIVSVEKGEKRDWKPEEISALLLGEMCRLASILLDSLVFDAVVTIPAYFNELQREATKKACAIAGINVLRIINEPTAAAIAYGIQEPSDHPRNVLIFDFGGGTCDVSILSMEKKQYTVLSSYGDNQLGGEDVDDILMYHLVKVFEEKHPDMHIDVDDMQKLRRECERAKKELGCLQMTDVIVKRVLKSDIVYRETITRGTFHSLISPLFPRILNPIKKCLQEANLEAKDINEVVLVGGSSLLQPIQNILKEQFPGVQLHMQIRPDEAIAYGAAIQAAISSGKYFETHLIIKDITPFSLGIEENSRFFDVLIPKNTPLPASMVKEFCTTRNYQSVAQFNVYQGENRFVKNNTFLGSFELTNIRRAPAERTKFNVTFILDLDGILTVSAMEIGTNNSKEIKINRVIGPRPEAI